MREKEGEMFVVRMLKRVKVVPKEGYRDRFPEHVRVFTRDVHLSQRPQEGDRVQLALVLDLHKKERAGARKEIELQGLVFLDRAPVRKPTKDAYTDNEWKKGEALTEVAKGDFKDYDLRGETHEGVDALMSMGSMEVSWDEIRTLTAALVSRGWAFHIEKWTDPDVDDGHNFKGDLEQRFFAIREEA